MKKKNLISENVIEKISPSAGYELVESINKENCLTEKTKLLIIGTLTPPKGQGYFYTSPNNKIYGYIDETLGTNLKELKSKLNGNKPETVVKEIKSTLQSQGIAFLDVIKFAIRDKTSCLDSDIIQFSLDFDSFKKITNCKNITIVCNSRNSERYYKIIQNELSKEGMLLPEHIFCSQRSGTKEKWKEIIRKSC